MTDKIGIHQRQVRREELDDIREMCATKGGRRFLWRLLDETRVFSPVFDVNPHLMNLYEGKRTVGLMVLNDLMEACPEKFITMQRGAKERENARRSAESDAGSESND